MEFHPLGPRLLPGQLPTLFRFYPFIFADLFLDQVCDPVKRIGKHHRRNLNVLFSFQNLTHKAGLTDDALGGRIKQKDLVDVKLHGHRLGKLVFALAV
jgi:hypothetical protein